MLHSPKSVFCIVAFLLPALVATEGCRKKSTDSPLNGSHVKVKLLNKDCMGYILAIQDAGYMGWGQADYTLGGKVYSGVSVIEGQQLLDDLEVDHEYYVDIQPVNPPKVHGACFRAPGPPAKLANVSRVY